MNTRRSKTNHSLRPKEPKSDPHFSRLREGSREPGFLEGGKMHTSNVLLIRLFTRPTLLYRGLANHGGVLICYENFLLYSIPQRLTNPVI